MTACGVGNGSVLPRNPAQERISGLDICCCHAYQSFRDHLDYHGSMEAYAAAKARLFFRPGLKCAVLNMDDAFGAALAKAASPRHGVHVVGYGFKETAGFEIREETINGCCKAENLKTSSCGLDFDVEFDGRRSVELKTAVC